MAPPVCSELLIHLKHTWPAGKSVLKSNTDLNIQPAWSTNDHTHRHKLNKFSLDCVSAYKNVFSWELYLAMQYIEYIIKWNMTCSTLLKIKVICGSQKVYSKPWGDMVMENIWDGWKNYISMLLSLFCKTFSFSFKSVAFPWETLHSCLSHLILFPSQNFVSECKVSWGSNNFAREGKGIQINFFFQFKFFTPSPCPFRGFIVGSALAGVLRIKNLRERLYKIYF